MTEFFKTSRVISKETVTPRSSRNSAGWFLENQFPPRAIFLDAFATQKRQTATSLFIISLFAAFTNVNNQSKFISSEVCSLGGHICNTSGQLKQDQVLSKWMGESRNLKNESLKLQFNHIFQISNKIWNKLLHECCFLCSKCLKSLLFRLN